jgi:hypothetical protein
MTRQQTPSIASILRELRWIAGWIWAIFVGGVTLALLERAGVGVTYSASLAVVEAVLLWFVMILVAIAAIVARPSRAHPESPVREFWWNWCWATNVGLAAVLFSFALRPDVDEGEIEVGGLLTSEVLWIGATLLVFGVLAMLSFNRAAKWSLAQEPTFPKGRPMAFGNFLLDQWRSLKGRD